MPGIDYTLGMKTGAFSSGLKSAMGGLADLGKKAAMLTATAGLAAGVGVGAAIAKGISSASRIETLETAFAPLLGGMAKARERMEELSKFAAATPFELPGIAQASKALEKPTSGLLSTGEGLRMVGDAAAYAQRPIEDVAGYVGQLYAALEGGGELGEGLQQLTELGIISYNAKNQISELNKTAGGGKAAWEIARREMESFTGSMEMLSITWNGKLSTLGDAIDQVFAKFGKPVMDSLKPYLDRLTTTIEGMEPMAQRVGTAIGDALDTAFSAWEEGKIFAFLGAGMKLAFIDAVNTLARLLQATVAGAMAGFEISGLLLAIDATFTGVAMKLKSAMSESLADFAETIGRFGVAKDLRKKAADESTAGGQAFGISKQALGTFNADTAAFAFQKKFKERMASDEAPLIDRGNAAADYEAIKAATADRTAARKEAADAKLAELEARINARKNGIAPGAGATPSAPAEKAAQSANTRPSADRLAQIGGFVGGAARGLSQRAAEKTASYMEKAVVRLTSIDKRLSNPSPAGVFL